MITTKVLCGKLPISGLLFFFFFLCVCVCFCKFVVSSSGLGFWGICIQHKVYHVAFSSDCRVSSGLVITGLRVYIMNFSN